MVIENLLKKIYKCIQKFTGESNTNNYEKNNNSGEQYEQDFSNNEKLNINNSNPYNQNKNYNQNDSQLRKIVDDKDLKIEELKNIIDVKLKLNFINIIFLIIDIGDEIKKFC